jgi:hypothetical protein
MELGTCAGLASEEWKGLESDRGVESDGESLFSPNASEEDSSHKSQQASLAARRMRRVPVSLVNLGTTTRAILRWWLFD